MRKEQSSKQEEINLLSTEKSWNNDRNEIEFLRRKFITQNNIIRQYDYWLHLLLNIVNENNLTTPKLNKESHNLHIYSDLATPIQKGLEKIDQIENENFEIKKKISLETIKFEELKKTYERLNNQLSILTEDLECKDSEKIILEKNQLFETVNAISDELECITLENKKLEKENEKNESIKLIEDIEKINQENNILKRIISLPKRNNSCDAIVKKKFSLSLKGTSEISLSKNLSKKSIFSCIGPMQLNQEEIILKK